MAKITSNSLQKAVNDFNDKFASESANKIVKNFLESCHTVGDKKACFVALKVATTFKEGRISRSGVIKAEALGLINSSQSVRCHLFLDFLEVALATEN